MVRPTRFAAMLIKMMQVLKTKGIIDKVNLELGFIAR